MKTRAAAVAETYANQGARAGSILPFTSSLSGLCAAVTVAMVEVLPFLHDPALQAALISVFPTIGALVAAAASVSKSRCEIDYEATTAAANELSRTDVEGEVRVAVDPVRATLDLVRLTLKPLNIRNLKEVFSSEGKTFLKKIIALLGLGPRVQKA